MSVVRDGMLKKNHSHVYVNYQDNNICAKSWYLTFSFLVRKQISKSNSKHDLSSCVFPCHSLPFKSPPLSIAPAHPLRAPSQVFCAKLSTSTEWEGEDFTFCVWWKVKKMMCVRGVHFVFFKATGSSWRSCVQTMSANVKSWSTTLCGKFASQSLCAVCLKVLSSSEEVSSGLRRKCF